MLESGLATPKEVQELARHSTLDLTMNVYGRRRAERLSAAVESVGDVVLNRNCVSDVYRQAVGAEHEKAQLPTNEEIAPHVNMAPEVGLEPTHPFGYWILNPKTGSNVSSNFSIFSSQLASRYILRDYP